MHILGSDPDFTFAQGSYSLPSRPAPNTGVLSASGFLPRATMKALNMSFRGQTSTQRHEHRQDWACGGHGNGP